MSAGRGLQNSPDNQNPDGKIGNDPSNSYQTDMPEYAKFLIGLLSLIVLLILGICICCLI